MTNILSRNINVNKSNQTQIFKLNTIISKSYNNHLNKNNKKPITRPYNNKELDILKLELKMSCAMRVEKEGRKRTIVSEEEEENPTRKKYSTTRRIEAKKVEEEGLEGEEVKEEKQYTFAFTANATRYHEIGARRMCGLLGQGRVSRTIVCIPLTFTILKRGMRKNAMDQVNKMGTEALANEAAKETAAKQGATESKTYSKAELEEAGKTMFDTAPQNPYPGVENYIGHTTSTPSRPTVMVGGPAPQPLIPSVSNASETGKTLTPIEVKYKDAIAAHAHQHETVTQEPPKVDASKVDTASQTPVMTETDPVASSSPVEKDEKEVINQSATLGIVDFGSSGKYEDNGSPRVTREGYAIDRVLSGSRGIPEKVNTTPDTSASGKGVPPSSVEAEATQETYSVVDVVVNPETTTIPTSIQTHSVIVTGNPHGAGVVKGIAYMTSSSGTKVGLDGVPGPENPKLSNKQVFNDNKGQYAHEIIPPININSADCTVNEPATEHIQKPETISVIQKINQEAATFEAVEYNTTGFTTQRLQEMNEFKLEMQRGEKERQAKKDEDNKKEEQAKEEEKNREGEGNKEVNKEVNPTENEQVD